VGVLQRDPRRRDLGSGARTGDGPARIDVVEPTGPFVDDPNLTNTRYPGDPAQSYRSAAPLRVVREYPVWQGHAPEVIRSMQEGIAGKEPIDD
jgi:rifampin ADP-ribosylating transferase